MKKLLFSMLLLSAVTYGQKAEPETYFSASLSADVTNLAIGSKPTNHESALDLRLKLHAVGKDFEMSPGYERFNQIGFERYSLDFGWHSQRYIPESWIPFSDEDFDFTAVPSIGFSMMDRYGHIVEETLHTDGKPMFFAVQGSMSFRKKISDKILLDWTFEVITRGDTKTLYPNDPSKGYTYSNYFGAHYVFN